MSASIAERLSKGEVLAVCEWRGFKVEEVTLTDTKTGRQRKSCVVRHAVELGADQVAITEWMPDGTDPKSIKFPYNRGDRLLVVLSGLQTQKGLKMASGKFEPVPK